MKFTLLRSISISGVLTGFIVVVATTICLSVLSPFIFSTLVSTGDMDILMTSIGPLSYALFVVFVSAAAGTFVCYKLANRAAVINVLLLVLLYAAFSYWLSSSPSNANKPYPEWYVWLSYLVLIPGAFVGHWAYIQVYKPNGVQP